MSATYQIITISGTTYLVYADQAMADQYLLADSNAATWRASTDDEKGRALVTATRTLDRQTWLGDKNEDTQELEWPRKNTGVTGVEDDVIPQDIIDACIEMANYIVNGGDPVNAQNVSQKEKRLKAGSVEVEYFRGAEGAALRFPMPVWELIAPYIGGTSATYTGSNSTGVTRDDPLCPPFGYNQGI